MARSPIVQPHTDVLTLPNGNTLIVKRRLNMGEQRESFSACSEILENEDGTTRRRVDPFKIPSAKMAAYLVDWTLAGTDAEIRGLDYAQRFLLVEQLDPEDFNDIRVAIDQHEAAMVAQRLAEKKDQAGERNGPAISPSRSDVAGPLTLSAH